MNGITIKPKPAFGLIAVALCLAGCGREAKHDPFGQQQQPSSANTVRDNFGDHFAKAMYADPNSEPMKVDDNDLEPVSLNKEPVNVN